MFIIGHLRGRSRREVFPIAGTDKQTNIPIKIIAHRDGYRRNTQTFSPDGITEALDTGQGGGRGHHVICIGNVNPSGNGMNGNVFDSNGLAPTVTTNKGEGSKVVIPVLTPDRSEKRQNGRRFKTDGEPMFTLTGQDRHGVAIYQTPRGKNNGGLKDIAPSLTRNSYEHNNHLIDGFRIRKLTPKECFRLQGFPDTYFERAASVNSNSQLYKQAGNSVTVNVIYEIAKKLGGANETISSSNP